MFNGTILRIIARDGSVALHPLFSELLFQVWSGAAAGVGEVTRAPSLAQSGQISVGSHGKHVREPLPGAPLLVADGSR